MKKLLSMIFGLVMSVNANIAPGANDVCFYEYSGYRGEAVCYEWLNYEPFDKNEMYGSLKNNVTSIRVGSNVKVRTFDGEGFTGHQQTFYSDNSFIESQYRDRVASFILYSKEQSAYKSDESMVCMYTAINYGGKETCFNVANYYEERSLAYEPDFYHKIKSIKVGKNLQIRVWNGVGFFHWLTQYETSIDVPDLTKHGITRLGSFKISIKPEKLISKDGDIIDGYNPTTQKITKINLTMAGASMGGDYKASIDNLGNGNYNAYFVTNVHAKVVSFKIEGNKIFALSAKYRYGNYCRECSDYNPINLAQTTKEDGYGIYKLSIETELKEANIKDLLPKQSDLYYKLNTLEFIKNVYSKFKVANLNLKDGYWIKSINLPENTNEIPKGSILKVTTRAGWDVYFKSKFILKRGILYTLIYNGKTWDISRSFGNRYIPLSGINFSESESDLAVKNIVATMNGSWVGGDYKATIDELEEGKYAAYINAGAYAKVVSFEITDGLIKTTGAKYRVGKYNRDATDYRNVSVATSATSSSYGIHNVQVTLGKYEPKQYNLNNLLGGNISQINTLEFMKKYFSRPNIGNLSLYDGYWIRNLDFPEYTSELAKGAIIKVKTTATWTVNFKGNALDKNRFYTFEYDGNIWRAVGQKNIKELLSTQKQLQDNLNTLKFLKDFYSKYNVGKLNLYNGYWIRDINLPENTDNIAVGSRLEIKTTAGWDVKFKGKVLQRGKLYIAEYDGSVWNLQ